MQVAAITSFRKPRVTVWRTNWCTRYITPTRIWQVNSNGSKHYVDRTLMKIIKSVAKPERM